MWKHTTRLCYDELNKITHNDFAQYSHIQKKREWIKWTEIQIGVLRFRGARSKCAIATNMWKEPFVLLLVGRNAKSFSIHYKRIQFRLWGLEGKFAINYPIWSEPLASIWHQFGQCTLVENEDSVCFKKIHQFRAVQLEVKATSCRCLALNLFNANTCIWIENSCE